MDQDVEEAAGHSKTLRPESALHSGVTMKNDQDVDDPVNMSSTSTQTNAGRFLFSSAVTSTPTMSIFTLTDEVLRRVIEKHKASLKRRFENISEGIIKSGAETLLNKIYTELYITEGESEGVNKEHEVWQVESASRAQTTEDTPINCNDIFKPLPGQEKNIRTVMTKGVAGIGKQSSFRELCFLCTHLDNLTTSSSQSNSCSVHRSVTEVRGFNDPQKEEYFRKRISDESQASRIISHIKASRSLHIMCHIPVFCWIAATVLQQMLDNTKDIPKTLTEMFIRFLLIQTRRKDQKYQSGTETDEEKLLKSQKEILLKLGELAFINLENGNLMFYEGDLKECGIDVSEASVYSGMCTEIFKEESVFHQRKVYCFVHLSIQEFLAAVFVFHSYVTRTLRP
ncbi:uncharacterized protein LOC122128918 [Clupea harengus]|uniref:Uncharacterized protein LOC122128918 n=1 Tax=Clupea harengus TaxID=7950 RepID=A0A8M1K7E8_CLUHA|nr:uncharacterized protein LOC122128918 [Clupea harengus]